MQHDLHATFMPKPIYGEAGSGMHVHQSLFKGDKNVFYDKEDELGLSQEAYYYIGGLLRHAPALTAITNPLINSYKRLVSGYEAPAYISWSTQNRSAMVRVPSTRGRGTRLELRNPDPSANPYLAMAVMLKAGLDGIKNQIELEEQVSENIFAMDNGERKDREISSLPSNIMEAVNNLKNNQLICNTLGSHTVDHFIKAKTIEWEDYKSQVHKWELDRYLLNF
jgi:glutamine synthetase